MSSDEQPTRGELRMLLAIHRLREPCNTYQLSQELPLAFERTRLLAHSLRDRGLATYDIEKGWRLTPAGIDLVGAALQYEAEQLAAVAVVAKPRAREAKVEPRSREVARAKRTDASPWRAVAALGATVVIFGVFWDELGMDRPMWTLLPPLMGGALVSALGSPTARR